MEREGLHTRLFIPERLKVGKVSKVSVQSPGRYVFDSSKANMLDGLMLIEAVRAINCLSGGESVCPYLLRKEKIVAGQRRIYGRAESVVKGRCVRPTVG